MSNLSDRAASFQGKNGSFHRGIFWRTYTPTTATLYIVKMKWYDRKIYLNHNSPATAVQVFTPLGADNGDAVEIYANAAVTTFTFMDPITGVALTTAGAPFPTTLAAGQSVVISYEPGIRWVLATPGAGPFGLEGGFDAGDG